MVLKWICETVMGFNYYLFFTEVKFSSSFIDSSNFKWICIAILSNKFNLLCIACHQEYICALVSGSLWLVLGLSWFSLKHYLGQEHGLKYSRCLLKFNMANFRPAGWETESNIDDFFDDWTRCLVIKN